MCTCHIARERGERYCPTHQREWDRLRQRLADAQVDYGLVRGKDIHELESLCRGVGAA